jgi:hypothetical protein
MPNCPPSSSSSLSMALLTGYPSIVE